MVNSLRLYVFLAGLDSHLDGVRGRILGTAPLPNLQAAYATVCAEANRQDAMLNVTPNDGVVMVVRKSFARDSKKGVRRCSHCNGDNHVIETCFKLHGYPEWHPKGKTSSPVAPSPKADGATCKSNLATTSAFVAKSADSVDYEAAIHYSNSADSVDNEDPVHDSTLSPTSTTEPLIQSSLDDSLEVSHYHLTIFLLILIFMI
ncbi:hypothetical protein Vadar_010129 [Vaccinium darrowii]|uniref:Uncharacterized protein n=1 Tax=Vaccinium darrowii TaxID=229202 RepID=A0ACB7YVD4_9ERIC|nr:hypothetical protein Vadar_010129 [Vaccinium darrowii]